MKRSSLRRSTLKLSAIVDDQWIALLGADHRQPDAGVAAGRLDHGLTGFQLAAPLGIAR